MFKKLKKIINCRKNTEKTGFTVLFAVLVSVLILSVGASIINLSIKQIVLSGSTRDSQYAFYAANTGVECVFYWDYNGVFQSGGTVFATSTFSGILTGPEQGLVTCGKNRSLYDSDPQYSITEGLSWYDDGQSEAKTSFWVTFSDVPYCAYVNVFKREISNPNTGISTIRTQIDSYGYNTCDSNNPRRIERGLRVNY